MLKYFTIRWLSLFVLLLGSVLATVQAQDIGPEMWLMRINQAASDTNFSGHFVYVHEGKVEAMSVTRRVKNGMYKERLYSLNGEAREVVKEEGRVWCYIPDKNLGVHDFRQTTDSGFPRVLPQDIDGLGLFYDFENGDIERIAGRNAMQIKVMPKDAYRYGYNLWADVETGLLLRSDLINQSDELIEQYLFVNIDIGRDISDTELEPMNNKEQLVWYGTDVPNLASKVEDSSWIFSSLPEGFELINHTRRLTPQNLQEEEHLVLTDGLSSISVFIKKSKNGQSTLTGLSKMGAIHAYRHVQGEHTITVMGEVPADTVSFVSNNISFQSP